MRQGQLCDRTAFTTLMYLMPALREAVLGYHMPPEREVSYRIDCARALCLSGPVDEAFNELREAERTPSQLARNNPRVREILRGLRKQTLVTGGSHSSGPLAMAQRCRMVQ